MNCQKCKKKQATVHMTEISGEEKKEVHLCEDCAQEQGLTLKGQVSLADFLAGLIKAPASKEAARLARLQCPNCGMNYLEFQSKGRFGCAEDYQVFSKLVEPLMEKIHGATEHVGKSPAPAGAGESRQMRLLTLRKNLKDSIEHENYEEAAEIRDQIRKIEGGESEAE